MYRKNIFRTKKEYLAHILPYGVLIDGKANKLPIPTLVVNKNGSVMTTLEYRGPDLESSIQDKLTAITSHLNTTFQMLDTGYVVYISSHRTPSRAYPTDNYFPDRVTRAIDEHRKNKFSSGYYFESTYYITICYIPSNDSEGQLKSLVIDQREQTPESVLEDNLKDFYDKVTYVCRNFKNLDIPCKFLSKEEMWNYLFSTVNGKEMEIEVPAKNILLDQYLCTEPLIGGNEPMIGSKYIKVIAPKSLPNSSIFGLLNELDRLGFAYQWVTRAFMLDKLDSESLISTRQQRWKGKTEKFTSTVRRVVTNSYQQHTDINENALMKVDETKEAARGVQNDEINYLYYSTAIVIREDDSAVATAHAKQVFDILQSKDMKPIIEDIGSVDSFLGCLAGNFQHNVRRYAISTGNLVQMMPISSIWAGPKRNKHLQAPPLMYTESDGSTQFRLSLHYHDVGHTLIVGPTGAGKSVHLNMIAAQERRYKDARVFIFDKGASSKVLTTCVGGNFFDLASDGSGLAFQPLANIDKESERMWAMDWLLSYLESVNITVNPEMQKYISDALLSLASLPIEHRTMLNLVNSIQNQNLKIAFRPLTIEGDFGTIFDSQDDDLEFSSWQVFEMEKLMGTKSIVGPTLMYIFHRIEEELKRDVKPTIIILDECWVFFDNPQFAQKIREWLKVLRKSNTSVIFATQSLADIVNSPILPAVLESCPSRIFLPNASATDDTPRGDNQPSTRAMYQSFGLNIKQITMISRAIPKLNYYYSSPLGNRMYNLALDEVELAFVGVGTNDVKMCNQIINRVGKGEEFLKEWLKYKDLANDDYVNSLFYPEEYE